MGVRDWFKKGGSKIESELVLDIDWTSIVPANLDYLFIKVSDEHVLRALDSWKWLPLDGLTILAVSAFGEVFFRNNTGAIFHLDTIEGQLSKVANDTEELASILDDEEAQDKILLGGFVIGARTRGMVLDEGECYDFKIAPILGGPMNAEQLGKTSFVVKLDFAGQIHEQVKDLPAGAKISHITVS